MFLVCISCFDIESNFVFMMICWWYNPNFHLERTFQVELLKKGGVQVYLSNKEKKTWLMFTKLRSSILFSKHTNYN